jgi:hypothetical protein
VIPPQRGVAEKPQASQRLAAALKPGGRLPPFFIIWLLFFAVLWIFKGQTFRYGGKDPLAFVVEGVGVKGNGHGGGAYGGVAGVSTVDKKFNAGIESMGYGNGFISPGE